jgi:geranylgeranyl pyrophosphate synthase
MHSGKIDTVESQHGYFEEDSTARATSIRDVAPWSASVKLNTVNVYEFMAPEMARVDETVREAAKVDFPIVSALIRDIVSAGGKRLRPLLLLLCARGFDRNLDRAVVAAAGVELLHTASLVHDDNIDRSSLRRGQPTLNTQVSSGAVILIGDYLFAQSAILAAESNDPRVVKIFATSLAEICDGQIRETLDAHRLDQSRDDYDRRIYGKTAALFAGATEMGAVIAAAPETAIYELRQFGTDLGMAFQIIDDVLDLREGTQVLGKPAGNDLRQGVVTLPVMKFLETASPEQTELVRQIVLGEELDDLEIDQLVVQIRASSAIATAEAEASAYIDRAQERLEVVPDQETRQMLSEVLQSAFDRSS